MTEILKLGGGILVFMASTLFGFYRSRLLVRRVNWIRATMHGLQRLETEISFRGSLLIEALTSIKSDRSGEDFFAVLYPFIMTNQDENARSNTMRQRFLDIRQCWEQSLNELVHQSPAKALEIDILRQLGRSLGRSDCDDQIKHLRLTAIQLQEALEQANAEMTKYQSMWRSLGLLGGAMMVILLY